MKSFKLVTVRVPAALHKEAKAKAVQEDVTVSQIVRRALREWVSDDLYIWTGTGVAVDGDDISATA